MMLFLVLCTIWMIGERLVQYFFYKKKRQDLRDDEVLVRSPYGLGTLPMVRVIQNSNSHKWEPSFTSVPLLIAKMGDTIQITSNSSTEILDQRQVGTQDLGKDLVIIRKQHQLITGLVFIMLGLLYVMEYLEETHEQMVDYLLIGAVILLGVFFYLLSKSSDVVIRLVKN